ncbi:hypothetical protein [Phocoenobacter skyensis]|uniref:Uncharacterized protein n=1 Tax=Phocoenobacter skyensis TaxID=97481 RepID=A0AAJ6P219_9PAST|nr:hypothetical protein [Pasteurella skyensis]MDP8174228.1 hypothetical protein [Pasteurella skyensis]
MKTNFDEILQKIEETQFFSRAGINEFLGENIILIKSLEDAFINNDTTDFQGFFNKMEYFPSSLKVIEDPFYKDIYTPKALVKQKVQISKMIFQKIAKLDENLFNVKQHNFHQCFKYSASCAFSGYFLENYLQLGNQWKRVVDIYYKGHYPFGFYKETLFVV